MKYKSTCELTTLILKLKIESSSRQPSQRRRAVNISSLLEDVHMKETEITKDRKTSCGRKSNPASVSPPHKEFPGCTAAFRRPALSVFSVWAELSELVLVCWFYFVCFWILWWSWNFHCCLLRNVSESVDGCDSIQWNDVERWPHQADWRTSVIKWSWKSNEQRLWVFFMIIYI